MRKLSETVPTTRIFVPVPVDMKERFEAKCADEGISSAAKKVRDLIAEYLDPSRATSNVD